MNWGLTRRTPGEVDAPPAVQPFYVGAAKRRPIVNRPFRRRQLPKPRLWLRLNNSINQNELSHHQVRQLILTFREPSHKMRTGFSDSLRYN